MKILNYKYLWLTAIGDERQKANQQGKIVKLSDLNYFWLAALLIACDPVTDGNLEALIDHEEKPVPMVPLPDIATDADCVVDTIEHFSGGDLHLLVDRIFVGEVRNVTFIEEGIVENCDPRLYEWTLRVEFQVEENLKGSGETATVLVSPRELEWNSHPVLKRDGIWLPQFSFPPATELSETEAWTGEFAIQTGQTLLIHAKERDGFLFTSGMPWGYPDGDGIRFQNKEWCGYALPQSLKNRFTLETLRGELLEPPLIEYRDSVMQYGYVTESHCRPNTTPTVIVSPDMGN